MSPMLIVLILHSMVRWLIVLAAVIGVIKFGLGLAQRQPFDKMSRIVQAAFSGLMDAQGLIGIIYLLWSGIATGLWPVNRFIHLAILLVAIAITHLPARLKTANDQEKYRNGLLVIVAAMVLVVVGVMVLGGNRWDFN